MEDRRTGGIVAAVTLTIAIAFAVVALLFLHTGVDVASQYAESETDLYSSELSSALDAYIRRQYTLVGSSLLDGELVECLKTEQSSNLDDVSKTQRLLAPLLSQLTVDLSKGQALLASLATHELYVAGQEARHIDDAEWEESWEPILTASARGTYTVGGVIGVDGRPTIVVAARTLLSGGQQLGILGVGIPEQVLTKQMADFKDGDHQEAVYFDGDGTVILSSDESVRPGSDVYASYPVIEDQRKAIAANEVLVSKTWTGLEGLLPHGQMLYEVRNCEEFGAYLLTANTAEAIFATMRVRVTTLVLALVVVMVLLLFLVMFIVRWYRARLIRVATTDELTGLANRKSFAASYASLVEEEMLDESFLALIDVDKFKGINDTYGHAAGDLALAAVAAEVAAMVDGRGICGRWGGDEFIAVLHCPKEEACERAQGLIDRVVAKTVGEDIHVSVSVGLAEIDVRKPIEHAVERADDALYVTKEGGRGFLTVYQEGVTPHITDNHVQPKRAVTANAEPVLDTPQETSDTTKVRTSAKSKVQHMVDLVVCSLLEAVHKMVPFVAGGGILIAVGFLIDAASVDVNTLSAEARASFGSITPIAAGLHDVGSAAFNFMLPIFAAFFASKLSSEEAFVAGFAGGFLASQGSAGFLGAIAAAVVAAVVVSLMRGFVRETATFLQRIAPVILYPVFSLLIMYLLMAFVIDPFATAFDAWLTSLLTSLMSGDRTVLGAVLGAFMATDMGGPINKAAYHFGTASIAAGSPDIMAAVMVGGMVPPCGIALSMLLFRDKYTDAERDQGPTTLFMGLSFITEGAIPFVLTDLLRVIPSCMIGSAVSGALSMLMGCTLMAPHGGIFVFPAMNAPLRYLVALLIGSTITAVILGLLKRPRK